MPDLLGSAPPSPPSPMIEVITFKGCQPTLDFLEGLEAAMTEHRTEHEVVVLTVPSPARAAQMGLYGSPTIRIGGVELQAEFRGPPAFY